MAGRPFLFGGSSGSQSQNKNLVEFRAGKMKVNGKMVHPDKRKGLVYVHQTDDSLMHFCWKDRTTGAVDDELIIFPDDAEFKKVPQCTTGRVFVLKFKSSNRRCFYWMQEPKIDKDDEFCGKVNEYLNNPPVPGSGHGSGLGSSGSSGGGLGSLQSDLSSLGDGDLQNLLNNISQQQLAQFLGSSGVANLSSLLSRPSSMQSSSVASSTSATTAPTPPARASTESATARKITTPSSTATPTPTPQSATPAAATTPSVPSSSAGSTQIQLSDVQSILSNLNEAGGSGVAVDLTNAITAEALAPLLGNAELMERVRSLLPSTQDAPKTEAASAVPEQLKNTVQSPQFQQSLSIFSHALQSGQLGPLMAQFGLSQEVVNAANSGDMEAFVRALQASQEKKDGDNKTDVKDEEMTLD